MLRIFWGALWLGIPAASAEPSQDVSDWDVRMMRVQGAAAGVRRAAEDVEVSAKKISDSGYLNNLTALKSQLNDLNRMVTSARLAVDVAEESVTTR